jgi:hypothetical protein
VKFEQKWYTLKEVGALLKMTPVTVAKHFRSEYGVLDVTNKPERPNARYKKHTRSHLRISADTLERWMRERMPMAS